MTAESVAAGIDELLDAATTGELVATYFTVHGPFAGHDFDALGPNPQELFCESDLLAVTLLDVAFGPQAMRSLLRDTERWHPLLHEVPADLPLWAADEAVLTAADRLWREVKRLPGVGPTRTGKLLARKRPALVPIYDSVIGRFLQTGDAFWTDLRAALQDQRRRERVDELGNDLVPRPTTLRIIDVMIWMRCGNSKNARTARRRVGLPEEPLLR